MNAITPMSVSAALATRAMVASLTISQWSGHRLDRRVTREVTSQHGADRDAGNFNKHLLPKEALEGINKVVSATRGEFLERTLPWLNDGSRIMNANAYMTNAEWFRKQKVKFNYEVEAFLQKYPGYINQARSKLGSMFEQGDYPSEFELRHKFGVELRILPVQTSDDWRVDMSDAQAEAIRKQIESTITEATNAAVKNIYERVGEVTKRMIERLTAYKPATKPGEKTEGVFRDSLVLNVRDLCNIMPQLNITGSPELDRLGEELRQLGKFDADILRNSDRAREETAAKAQAILNQIGDFLA